MLGFVIGLSVAGLLFLGTLLPLRAGAGEDQTNLVALLPDIGRIYREALVRPFQQVKEEIKDEQIAQFYHDLLHKCGLDQLADEQNSVICSEETPSP